MKRHWPYYAQMMIGIANAIIQVIGEGLAAAGQGR
jgi:hypothetical protein